MDSPNRSLDLCTNDSGGDLMQFHSLATHGHSLDNFHERRLLQESREESEQLEEEKVARWLESIDQNSAVAFSFCLAYSIEQIIERLNFTIASHHQGVIGPSSTQKGGQVRWRYSFQT